MATAIQGLHPVKLHIWNSTTKRWNKWDGGATITDGGGSITVDAVDLDIRNLTSVSDSVSAVQSGTWNITNISGTISLPTGAATSAKQDTLLTELQLKADLTETQPVSLASVPTHAVTNAGTFVVQENGAALTALQLIDNAVSGAGFNITQFGGAAVPIGAGTEAAAIRVTLPTDGTGVVKLGTGANVIGAVTQSGTWNVGSSYVLGAAVPANAFFIGMKDSTGALKPAVTVYATGDGSGDSTLAVGGYTYNGSTFDRIRGAINALNTTGTGVQSVQLVGQFDDTSPTSITENQFGNLRISQNRNLYVTLRDAAGNERGLNIDTSGNLAVTQSGTWNIGTLTTITNTVPVGGNVAAGATDSGNPVKFGLKYNATPPTLTDGQRGDAQGDINANLKITGGTNHAGEDVLRDVVKVEHRYSYGRVTADGQIRATAGFVHTVNFSATGAVTAGVITLYDNTAESGNLIWSGTVQVTTAPISILLDVNANVAIYVGYDGTIANVATTVSHR